MKYYFIGEIEVTDQSWVPEYVSNVTGLVERSGGRYLARTPKIEKIEGERKPLQMCDSRMAFQRGCSKFL
jgi:uncharacterized protein (DUF1330 family)